MKKIFLGFLAIFMVFALVGCMGSTGETALAKRLSTNTNNLLNAINSLEVITTEDVTIPEFSNISSISNFQTVNSKSGKVSKVKQLFKRNDLANIKNIEETNIEPRFMTNTQNYGTSVYQPKYVSLDTNTNNYLDLFKSKIENLYNVCSDCNYINSECTRVQKELKTSVEECKNLCLKLESGEIKLDEQQLNICNSYSKQINLCVNRIKDCKGDCNNYIQTLRALKGYFGSNSDILSNNYLNLLGCLENRLGCYKEALECVNNCNNLLKSCYTPVQIENNTNKQDNTIVENNINNQTTLPQENNVNQNNPNGYNVNNTYNSNNGYNPNGYNQYNSNNGYYNGAYNSNYTNPYNQTPNNVNTYGPIYKNIDTYGNNVPNNNVNPNYSSNSNYPISSVVSEENKTISESENKNIVSPKKLEKDNQNDDNKIKNEDETKSSIVKIDKVQNESEKQSQNLTNKTLDNSENASENSKVELNNETQNTNINNDNINNNIEEKVKNTNIDQINLKEEKFVSKDIKTLNRKPKVLYKDLNNKDIQKEIKL